MLILESGKENGNKLGINRKNMAKTALNMAKATCNLHSI